MRTVSAYEVAQTRKGGMMESLKVVRKLYHLAEVLVATTDFSKYCHTLYEASAEIERLTGELAAAHRILDFHKIQFRPKKDEKTRVIESIDVVPDTEAEIFRAIDAAADGEK